MQKFYSYLKPWALSPSGQVNAGEITVDALLRMSHQDCDLGPLGLE